jgi:2-iminobutanoate/2-iminopropanoate deaminase
MKGMFILCGMSDELKPSEVTLLPGPNEAYSLGAGAGNLLFLSTHAPGDGLGGGLEAPLEDQVRQAFGRMFGTLARAGVNHRALVKLDIYLADIADFAAFNELYFELVPAPRPARATVQTPIGKGWKVAVGGVALLPGRGSAPAGER